MNDRLSGVGVVGAQDAAAAFEGVGGRVVGFLMTAEVGQVAPATLGASVQSLQ